jgi:hypothetical protein
LDATGADESRVNDVSPIPSRKAYDAYKKEQIMELYDKEKSIAKVAMLTGVDRSCISRWLKKRFEISQQKKLSKRSPKVYKNTINDELEKKVIRKFKYIIKQ